MSFILDALRKSENERQQQTPAGLSTVPSSLEGPRAPRWLWLLAGLLAINVVIVAALLLKSNAAPSPARPVTPAAEAVGGEPAAVDRPAPAPATEAGFADQLEQVRRSRPAKSVIEAPAALNNDEESIARNASRSGNTGAATAGVATLPSLDEVRLSGALALPEMHIDLHVYSATPGKRFVSINGKKYRQQDTLTDGPTVREITPDGVILDYQGTRFALIK
jgi:general secretion pathway protein B